MTSDKRTFDFLIPISGAELALHNQLGPEAWHRIGEAIRASKADSTWRTYRSAWRAGYLPWCERNGLEPLPVTPAVLAAYVTEATARLRPRSVEVHVAAIAALAKLAGHEAPTRHPLVEQVLAGIRRGDERGPLKKKAIRITALKKIVEALPDNVQGIRDRAVITCAWWGALRRSEVVALDCDDLDFEPEGVRVHIRHSKGDQEGEGAEVALPSTGCPVSPVSALRAWIDASGVTEHLFAPVDRWGTIRGRRLTGQSVALILKRAAERAGMDARVVAGHSARRGFITEAAAANVAEHVIAKQSRHRSVATLRGYVDSGSIWSGAAAQVARKVT